MSNHIDPKIQGVKDLTEYAERNTCSATMVPTESLRALLSEYKRLQQENEEMKLSMETAYGYMQREKYMMAEDELEQALSHLKGE